MPRGVLAAFGLELRRARRDRITMVMTFLAPVAIASIVVFALGDTDDIAPSRLGFVVPTAGDATALFVTEVVENPELSDFVEWTPVANRRLAAEAVASQDLGAAIIVQPPVDTGGPAVLEVLGDEDPLASGVAATIVDEFRIRHTAALIAIEAGVEPAVVPDRELRLTSPGGRSIDASVHWGPALGAFFVLLSMGYAAQRQVSDRQRGIVGRVVSTATPGGAILVGRALAATTLATGALLLMAASAQVLFGRAWGSWDQVLLMAVATAVSVAGIGAVLAAVARTPGQAQTLTAVASFGFAIGGGSFSPPGASGPPGAINRWFPTSLSLDGFSVVTTTGRLADLVVPVTSLCGIGLVLFIAAVTIAGRRAPV